MNNLRAIARVNASDVKSCSGQVCGLAQCRGQGEAVSWNLARQYAEKEAAAGEMTSRLPKGGPRASPASRLPLSVRLPSTT